MANLLRGEVTVTLFEKEWVLRPDIESICEIEDAANGDSSVALMFLQMSKGVVTFKTIGFVFYGCLKTQHSGYSLKQVLAEVKRIGISGLTRPVVKLLAQMVSSDEAIRAEEKKSEPVAVVAVQENTG